MTTKKDQAAGKLRVFCRRVGQERTPDEHVGCPYCFGRESDVQEDGHEKFCDFDPDKDPINFGFPTDSGRNRD